MQGFFARRPEEAFLNLPLGAMITGKRLFLCRDRSNPLLSYCEPLVAGGPVRTAYRMGHQWAARVAPVHQLWRPPLWAQTVHETNAVTTLRGAPWPFAKPPAAFSRQAAFRGLDAGAQRRAVGGWATRRAAGLLSRRPTPPRAPS